MGVKIVDTALRDGHQSLFATRMRTEEILSILPDLDAAGYHAIEVWGGATFDACLRFLNEDPWERLRQIRKVCKNTKLQMLFRGQNILGYKHYPDDIVEMFVKKSLENGIDIIRVFDALNDLRNMETAVTATKRYGGHCQVAFCYTTSPIHTVEYFVALAKKIEAMGADSLCIKDMSGVLLPEDAYRLVKELKANVGIPIELHSHCTAGVAHATYMKAIEAGVDIIDTALSPLSSGTSQPPTESFQYILRGTPYDPGLDLDRLNAAAEKIKSVRDKYLASGQLDPKALMVNPLILQYQLPGGMLSNLMSQLTNQGASDRYEEVLREVPAVRADLGYPPLVTPLSQMVGTQAVMNVLTGERYKLVPEEIKDYLRGQYGAAPGLIDEGLRRRIIGADKVIEYRPAEDLEPQFEVYREKYKELTHSDEDVLSIALFESVAVKFLENKYRPKESPAEVYEINLHI